VINELAEKHWHSVLQESLVALKSILSEIDSAAYEKALAMAEREKAKKLKNSETSGAKWERLQNAALKKYPNLKLLKKD